MIPTPEIYLALAIAGFWVSSCSQYPIRENGEYPSQIYLESVLAACVPSAGLEDSVAMGASLRYGPSGKAALCLWLLAPRQVGKWHFVRPILRILIEFSLIFSKPEQGIRRVCRSLGSVNF